MTTPYTDASQVASEIGARLATILTADGFAFNIGAKVLDGAVKIDDKMTPCVSIIEGADLVQQGPSQRVAMAHIQQQYALVAYVPCDPAAPNTAAREVIRDIKRSIFRTEGKPDPTWGGKVRGVKYVGRNIGPRADGAAVVMAVVELSVEFAEDLAA